MSMVEGSLSVDLQLAAGSLERLQKQLSNLEKGISLKIAANSQGVQQAGKAIGDLEARSALAANRITSKLGGAFKSIGATVGALAAVGGAGLVAIATKAILAGKEFNVLQQGVRASLTAILGTSAAAEDLLAKVNALNDTSPFPRSSFLAATQQLVGFGVKAEKVVGILDAVQNAVAGIGGDTNDIALFTRAIAQIQSQGKLTGDVLFSLGEKGVDAAAIIGKQMGKTGEQIKAQVTKGAIGAEEAIDALTAGLKEKFGGAVENVAKSFVGAKDRVTARLRDIGADITKAFINPLGGGAAVEGFNNIAVALSNIRKKVISELLPSIQSAANLFVKATKIFLDFTASIKTEQVERFLGIFKALIPVIAAVGAKLVSGLAGGIPVIGGLARALGGPIAAIAIIIATVPVLRSAFLDLVEALRPLVEALLPVFASSLTTVQGLFVAISPLLQGLITAISGVVTVLVPMINFLQKIGLAGPLLTFLIGKFIIAKIAGTEAFLALSISLTSFHAKLITAGLTTGTLRQRLVSLGSAGIAGLKGIGNALVGLVSPANIALVALTLLTIQMGKNSAAAQEMGVELRKGLNFNEAGDRDKELIRLKARMVEIQALLKKKPDNFFSKSFVPPASALGLAGRLVPKFLNKDKAKKELDEVKKIQKEIKDINDAQQAVGEGVLNKLKGTNLEGKLDIAGVLEQATKAGIDFSQVPIDKVTDTVDLLVKKIQEIGPALATTGIEGLANTVPLEALDKIRSAEEKVTASEKALSDLRKITGQQLRDDVTKAELGLADARRGVGAAADGLISAEINLAQAKRGVSQADEHLADVTKQRNALLADTNREVRELADAEAGLARTKAELIDQDEREAELRKDLADLSTSGPDKLAAADRAILRAKIALNTATRDEKELQDELNKSQAASPDLAGLSLDQIKTKLAGARAQLAVQRQAKSATKSAQEIEDESTTAKLNTVDAEQAYKDAIQARGDLELSQNIQKREDEEALQGLQLDHEDSLRRQEEQQIALSALRAGDTATARELKSLNEEIIVATEGVTTAALALHGAERDVATAKEAQLTATISVRDAEIAVRDAKGKILEHSLAINEAQKTATADALTLKGLKADQLGDEQAINQVLVERLRLNSAIISQSPELIKKIVDTLFGAEIFGDNTDPVQALQFVNRNTLSDILVNHPDQLLEFLKKAGFQLGDGPGAPSFSGGIALDRVKSVLGSFPGAVITSTYRTPDQNRAVGGSPTSYHLDKNNPAVDIGGPTSVLDELYRRLLAMGGWRELLWRVKGHYDHIHAAAEGLIVRRRTLTQIGEGGKAEVVLPLTKPARAMTLLSQSIPLMHTSLQKRLMPALVPQQMAASESVLASDAFVRRGGGTKTTPFVSRSDGPATYGQVQELIALIKAQKSGNHVEAPITVMSSGQDEELLARKISNRVEKKVSEILSRR